MAPGRDRDDGREGGFRGLDPADDPAAWERRVEAITASAEAELRRRAEALAPAFELQLERWARPVMAAAAVLIVAGASLLVASGQPPRRAGRLAATASSRSGETLVSPVVDPWLESDTLSIEAVEELVSAGGPGGMR